MSRNIYDDCYRAYRCKCVYCGLDGLNDIRIWFNLQIDHLVPNPIKLQDRETALNIVVACKGCNGHKGSRDPSERRTIAHDGREKKKLIERAKRIVRDRQAEHHGWFRSHGGRLAAASHS